MEFQLLRWLYTFNKIQRVKPEEENAPSMEKLCASCQIYVFVSSHPLLNGTSEKS